MFERIRRLFRKNKQEEDLKVVIKQLIKAYEAKTGMTLTKNDVLFALKERDMRNQK